MPALLVRARPWLRRTRLISTSRRSTSAKIHMHRNSPTAAVLSCKSLYLWIGPAFDGSSTFSIFTFLIPPYLPAHLYLPRPCSFPYSEPPSGNGHLEMPRERLHCHPPGPWPFSRFRIIASWCDTEPGWIRQPQWTVFSGEQWHRWSSKVVMNPPAWSRVAKFSRGVLGAVLRL